MTLVDRLHDRFGVEPILRVLEIPTSTFYGWVARRRRASPRDIEEGWLGEQIERSDKDSGGTYGSPKVHAQLRREGIRTSRKRVERLMRQAGLQGAFKRKRGSTRRDPAATPAPDLVGRQFTAPAPNRLWVADISRIPTGEGPLWLASVRDAFSRRVVGWKASDRADTELVLGGLEYALWSRQVQRERLVFHSDHGAQYTAIRFTQRLVDAGARPSMGSVGDSYDNALAENFFSSLKVERVYRTTYRTREEAELDLVRWIDGWYNPRRIQRELGWLSPDEYEEAYYRRQSSGIQASPAGAR
jgi:transposase InsO family protein